MIIGQIVLNMSNLQEEVFGGNTTLWDVLNTQGVPELADQTRQIKEQLDSLALTVQNYQNQTNAELVRINSNITTINTQLSSVLVDIADLKSSNENLQALIVAISAEISSISSSLVTLTSQVTNLQSTVDTTVFRVDNLSNTVTTLQNRVTDLETNQNGTFIRYNTLYSVIEWPFWQTGWESYEMIVSGTGGYVPLNRSVTTVINGISRSTVFGIAFRDIPPTTGGAPAPLMEGLASANFGQGASLIYINKTQ